MNIALCMAIIPAIETLNTAVIACKSVEWKNKKTQRTLVLQDSSQFCSVTGSNQIHVKASSPFLFECWTRCASGIAITLYQASAMHLRLTKYTWWELSACIHCRYHINSVDHLWMRLQHMKKLIRAAWKYKPQPLLKMWQRKKLTRTSVWRSIYV